MLRKHLSCIFETPLEPAATLAVKATLQLRKAKGLPVIDCSLGQNPLDPPPVVTDALRHISKSPDLLKQLTNYQPGKGQPELLDQIAAYHSHIEGRHVSPDNVIVMGGDKTVLGQLFFLFGQNASRYSIHIQSPRWVSYRSMIRACGLDCSIIHALEENRWHTTAEQLQASFSAQVKNGKTPVFVLTRPSNPDGTDYSPKELKAVAAVCRDFNAVVIADEMYGELLYRTPYIPFSRYYDRVITTSGTAKFASLPGCGIGYSVVSPSLRNSDPKQDLMSSLGINKSQFLSSVNGIGQYIAYQLFADLNSTHQDSTARYLTVARMVFETLTTWVRSQLSEIGFTMPKPDGTFYLFPRLSSDLQHHLGMSGVQFCNELVDQTGIGVVPGESFGRPTKEISFRLACVDIDRKKAFAYMENAVRNSEKIDVDTFISDCCPNMAALPGKMEAFLTQLKTARRVRAKL